MVRESALSKPLDVDHLGPDVPEVGLGVEDRGTLEAPAVAKLLPIEPPLHLLLGHSELDQRIDAGLLRGSELPGASLVDPQAATAMAVNREVDILEDGRDTALEPEADHEGPVGLPWAEAETTWRESGAHLDAVQGHGGAAPCGPGVVSLG